MEYEKKNLSLEEGLKREWIITNGLGGYSATTILGVNTRKYHGLLVASLSPPAKRALILSKLDEILEIEGINYNLYTNICKNYISDGYKYLQQFKKDYIPIFTYEVNGIVIKKLICMQHGKNTVCILYKIQNGEKYSKFKLTPVINFRNSHYMSTNHDFKLSQDINGTKLKVIVDDIATVPIYMKSSEGNYIKHEKDIFKNMYYVEEEKRGFFAEENHAVPGRYEIEIKPYEEKEITFVCSLEENIEEINSKDVINDEVIRLNEVIYDSKLLSTKKSKEKQTKEELKQSDVIKNYIIATDNFIVYRPSFGLHTVVAGYPWFLDWGRDTLISFEGLLLLTKRYGYAKEVLLTFTKDIKFGLVPNGYSDFDNKPLYNSVDASLLIFEQVYKFLKYTNDYNFIKHNIYKTLVYIIESYLKGINVENSNIFLDKDNLLSAGTDTTQLTWMDAKYGNFIATPRNGKAVEINAMWYNALKVLEELTGVFENKQVAKKYADLAKKCQKSFIEKFYNPKTKCLYDVIGDSKIRPNQLFAISLSYPVLPPNSEISKEMFETVTKKLLNKKGLKTLAKGEKGYIEIYEGDSFRRDMSYHQGITWPWLLGIYADGFKNIIKYEKSKKVRKELEIEYQKFIEKLNTTFEKAIYDEGAIGSISELYNSQKPFEPKGAFAQAWSVAEVFRIILNK